MLGLQVVTMLSDLKMAHAVQIGPHQMKSNSRPIVVRLVCQMLVQFPYQYKSSHCPLASQHALFLVSPMPLQGDTLAFQPTMKETLFPHCLGDKKAQPCLAFQAVGKCRRQRQMCVHCT